MKRLISILSLAALWPVGASWAQVAAPNEAGVAVGHLHLNVRDMEANKKFWIALGATPIQVGPREVMKLAGVLVFLTQAEPSGGSLGTIVNHVGFQVRNVQESMSKWKAAGFKTEPGRTPQGGNIFTPDEMRLEILEDASLSVPIQLHHIHFFVAEAGSGNASTVAAIKAWYVKVFGAKPGKRGDNEAADVPGANLTFTKSATPTVAIKGRALDHIGFEIKNLKEFIQKLEASGLKLDRPYTERPEMGLAIAFLTDPWGTYIELTEGLNRL